MQRRVSSFWDRLAGCITGIYDTSSQYSRCLKGSHILTGACKRTRASRPIDAPQNLSLLANPSHAAFVGILRHSRPSPVPISRDAFLTAFAKAAACPYHSAPNYLPKSPLRSRARRVHPSRSTVLRSLSQVGAEPVGAEPAEAGVAPDLIRAI